MTSTRKKYAEMHVPPLSTIEPFLSKPLNSLKQVTICYYWWNIVDTRVCAFLGNFVMHVQEMFL